MSVDTHSGIRCGQGCESRYWHYRDLIVGTIVIPLGDQDGIPRFMMSDACHLPTNINLHSVIPIGMDIA